MAKVYVQGYRTTTEKEREEERRRLAPWKDISCVLVDYSKSPEWRMEQYGADMHLPALQLVSMWGRTIAIFQSKSPRVILLSSVWSTRSWPRPPGG